LNVTGDEMRDSEESGENLWIPLNGKGWKNEGEDDDDDDDEGMEDHEELQLPTALL
jgi:hypothetical protein